MPEPERETEEQRKLRTEEAVKRLVPKICEVFGDLELGKAEVREGLTRVALRHKGRPLEDASLTVLSSPGRLASDLVSYLNAALVADKTLWDESFESRPGRECLVIEVSHALRKCKDPALRRAYAPFGAQVRAFREKNARRVRSSREQSIRRDLRALVQKLVNKHHLKKDEVVELMLEQAKLFTVEDVLES